MNLSKVVLALGAGVVVLAGSSAKAVVYFSDDFSTFTPGNLVGQPGWTQQGSSSSQPIQVVNGRVEVVGGLQTDAQDAIRDPNGAPIADGTSLFLSSSFRVDSAPSSTANNGNGSAYFFAVRMGTFDNGRIVARQSATDPTKYVLGHRITGQAANPFVFGTTELSFGQEYTMVYAMDFVAGATNDVFTLYINPNSDRASSTAYLGSTNGASDPTSVTGVVISQFGNATVNSAGVSISRLALTNNFGEAVAAVPEPGTLAALGLGAVALLRRRAKK